MQRYDLYESEMIDHCDGKYVLHEDAQYEINRLRAENERLRKAVRDLLRLPVAVKELEYLRKGIGTETDKSAWLRARDAVSTPHAPDNRGA